MLKREPLKRDCLYGILIVRVKKEILSKIRKVKFGDPVHPDDHNLKVYFCRLQYEFIKVLCETDAAWWAGCKPLLKELEDMLNKMRLVREGYIVQAQDHNLIVEFLEKVRKALPILFLFCGVII